jgi:hypothetical protein
MRVKLSIMRSPETSHYVAPCAPRFYVAPHAPPLYVVPDAPLLQVSSPERDVSGTFHDGLSRNRKFPFAVAPPPPA